MRAAILKVVFALVIFGAVASYGTANLFSLLRPIKTYPEELQFAEGTITRFEPYFNKAMSSNPNRELRRGHTLFGREGVDVTIVFDNGNGEQQTLHETWKLPTFDHFESGDSIDLFWEKAIVAKPKSVVMGDLKLQAALRNSGEETQNVALRQSHTEKIKAVLVKHASLYKQCGDYYQHFYKKEKDGVSVRFDHRKRRDIAVAEYEAAARKRLAIIRETLGIKSRNELFEE